MSLDADALVVGAGPAGTAAAMMLARAGWTILLAEQHVFPRQKVCGECISAGSLALLDDLGIGAEFRDTAGPELRRIGWMSGETIVVADFPPCSGSTYRYGRALGRDRLDAILLNRAKALGVEVLQPCKVRGIRGIPGHMDCEIEVLGDKKAHQTARPVNRPTIRVRLVIDAHGSWEPAPKGADAQVRRDERARGKADLFGFKATFHNTRLSPGLLPVLALDGGYGGMVVADGGRTTLACCIRRDTLDALRAHMPGAAASEAVAAYLRQSCRGVREAMDAAQPSSPWLSVGPVRPGIRLGTGPGTFQVGNAAGETHPLIGEGINMALQSAVLLAARLVEQPAATIDAARAGELNRRYSAAWQTAFSSRLRLASGYAQIAMRPALTAPARALLQKFPSLLTRAARFAGKDRRAVPIR